MVRALARPVAPLLALALLAAMISGCSPSVPEMKAKGDIDGLIGILRSFGEDADEAASALGEIGDARAVPALADAAISAGGETSTAAVAALGKIDSTGSVEGLAAVLRATGEDDALRARAAVALGELGNPAAIQPLVEAVQRLDDVAVLAATVDALAALEPEADEETVRALLRTVTHEPALADSVDRVLAGMGPGAVDAMVALFVESSSDRGAAEEALVRRGIAAVPALAAAVKVAGDDDFFRLVDILQAIKNPGVVAALARLVADSDPDARVNGIRALALVGGEGAAESILPALSDDELEVRLAAIEGLGTLGDTAATGALVKLLKDKDVKVRTAAAKALGELGDTDATKALVAGLKDAKLSSTAALALAKLYKDDPDKLVPYLKSKATVGVYFGLIRIGADSTIPALKKALTSFGTKSMAEDYLNCGSPDLEDAARAWAKKHGYNVVTQPGGGAVQWGSGL